MNQKTKSKVLDDVAQQYHPKEIDLSSRILSKAHREKVNTMKIKFALTAVTSIVCVIAVLFAIPTTAAAMKRIFWFIPGIGLVNDTEPLRVLQKPVEIEREGTTVTVLQGVIDSENTTIIYQVENLPDFQYSIESQISDVCHLLPA